MRFQIRLTNDKAAVSDLDHKLFPSDYFYEHEKNFMWLAYSESGELAGFCMATDYGHGIMFLARAGVVKKFRGKGLHKRMIKARESLARRRGFKYIITYTMKDNYQSFAHLIKMNYQIYEPEYAYAGNNVLYFIKALK